MSDYQEQGLLRRYDVRRTDGKPEDPGAKFFVLRYDKYDPWGAKCRAVLREFAAYIARDYPQLSSELLADVLRVDGVHRYPGPDDYESRAKALREKLNAMVEQSKCAVLTGTLPDGRDVDYQNNQIGLAGIDFDEEGVPCLELFDLTGDGEPEDRLTGPALARALDCSWDDLAAISDWAPDSTTSWVEDDEKPPSTGGSL